MKNDKSELLSAEPTDVQRRMRSIIDFWTALYQDGDAGATTWEVLDRLRDRVTTALHARPPDIRLAESLTARAASLLSEYWAK
jgi:hypothetical protein